MPNTTDIMITSLFDAKAIGYISKQTDIPLKKVTYGVLAGGPKVLAFEAYGACIPCIDKDKIENLINAFQSAPFENPEYAVLLIDDDNDNFSGIVTHNKAY